uniref:Coiled-coil domain-containing protein 7 n=1 Tax=Castor canadensis TaxID=51338 RepID=A0A8C0W9L5_CASCN
MKSTKQQEATIDKWASVSEMSHNKLMLNSPLSPKPKGKHSAKTVGDKIEPMVLRSPPTGESIVWYALPIPSSKTKELMSEEQKIKSIIKHLKMVVSTLEETYGFDMENGEKPVVKPDQEGLTFSLASDMNSFLVSCSQFSTQLEDVIKEQNNSIYNYFLWLIFKNISLSCFLFEIRKTIWMVEADYFH